MIPYKGLTTRSQSAENISMFEKGFRWLKATNENWQEKRYLKNRVKILVIGLPFCGKTCLLNNLKSQTSCSFSNETLSLASALAINVIFTTMDKITDYIIGSGLNDKMPQFSSMIEKYQSNRKHCDSLQPLKDMITKILLYPITEKVVSDLHDELPMNYRHFLDSIDRIANQDYVPIPDDVIRVHIPSPEIEEAGLVIRRNSYALTTLAGSRLLVSVQSICYFADSASIIFMVFLDRFESDLHQALDIFKQITKVPYLFRSAFIFLLNRSKDFGGKVKKLDINYHFPDFSTFWQPPDRSLQERVEFYVSYLLSSSILKSQIHYSHISDVACGFSPNDLNRCVKASIFAFNLANYYLM